MRCIFLRGFAFLAAAGAAMAIGSVTAGEDGGSSAALLGEIRVVEPAADGATDNAAKDSTPASDAASTRRVSPLAERLKAQEDDAEDAASEPAAETKPAVETPRPAAEPTRPTPNAQQSATAAIEATSFKGVIPGASTQEAVEKAWGAPKKTSHANGSLVQLYSVEPFKRVEAHYAGGKVASIVIRLDRSFPVEMAAKQLDLQAIRPVLVSNATGEVLGAAYPERGVLFGFEASGKSAAPSMKVLQIILEPISAEAFVLRAETALESHFDLSRRDLQQALTLEPGNARAHWLASRVATATEENQQAMVSAREAARLEPDNCQYRVTYAQALARMGRLAEAAVEAQKAAAAGAARPHVKARAVCLLGDLAASGPNPDFKKSLALHTQAIQIADPLLSDPHPAVRVAAKEVLISAHLGAAHDIAWGQWKEKAKAVTRWLDRARALAEDLTANDGGNPEQVFHVYARTLSALVGVRGAIDPAPVAKAAVTAGEKLIAASSDAAHKAQLQWELGMALYDAVQVCQMRSEPAAALRHGEAATGYLVAAVETKPFAAYSYQLGRLYFRLGMIYATRSRDGDHKTAVVWYDKALPLLERIAPDDLGALGRYGEALASMGVSYWKTGDRDKAVMLTQKGVQCMEQAVKLGTFDRASLALPYGNLAAMHRDRGNSELGERFEKMASRARGEDMK
jgi:tetratricopeptide (TPR) repeat protein